MRHIVFIDIAQTFGGREKRLIDWLRFVDHSRVNTTIIAGADVYSGLLAKYRLPTKVSVTKLDLRFSLANSYKSFRILQALDADEILFMQGAFFEIPLFLVFIGFIVTRGAVSMSEHLAAPPPPIKSSRLHFGIIPGLGLWWYKRWYRQRLFLRWRYLLSKKVIAVSNSVKQGLIKWGCPEEKISVISHGVNLQLFRPSPEERSNFRETRRIPQEAIVIVSTARFERHKRLERLTKAFDFLSGKHPNLWLILAGDGPLSEQLSADIVTHQNRVLFIGHLTEKDVANVLKASDIYVLPTDNEGAPNALLEAMAAGLICVATNVPGPIDIIQDGINGFLVDPSEEAVLSTLEKLLSADLDKHRRMAEKALNTASNYEMAPAVLNVLSILNIPSIDTRE